MRRISPISIASSEILLVITLIAAAASADELQPATAPQPGGSKAGESIKTKSAGAGLSKRLTYTVQYGSPKDLAAVLEQHFQGEAEFRTLSEPSNRSLLIAASPDVVDEVVRTLAQLDRAPQKIIVDVWIIDEGLLREEGASPNAVRKALDERQLTGPVEEVSERLENLSKTNALDYYRQLRLENLEDRENTVQVGEEKPRVNGYMSMGVGGQGSPTIQQRAVGTIVTVTARVVDANKVLLDVVFRDDRLGLPEEGTQIATGADGPIMSPDVFTTHLKAKLTVPAGQAVIANRVETDTRSKRSRRQIVIAARPTLPEPRHEKK
jgi:type II secretory pathway component GspD/PulD (secretin)